MASAYGSHKIKISSAVIDCDIGGFCANCELFGWKGTSDVKKCSRCHVVAYCGQECQEEHWHKVHKEHCKYLGGIKKAKHSEHRKDACTTCMGSGSTGDPTNSNYACIFENLDWNILPATYPHPFPLNGSPEDRIEKLIIVAQRILLKVKVTKSPVYLAEPQHVEKLDRGLWALRGKMYLNRIYGGDFDPLTVLSLLSSPSAAFKSHSYEVISDLANCYSYQPCSDDYKLMVTFAMVREMVFSANIIHIENTLKSTIMLPDKFRQMLKKDRFFEVVDQIIEVLDQNLVPHRVLAAIACGGKTEQSCCQCHKRITVQGVFLNGLRTFVPRVVFNPLENERYVCESQECYDKEHCISEKMGLWFSAIMATVTR